MSEGISTVDVVGRKVENQIQFWSLLGPSLVLLSIAVLLFKVSTHWYFPVSALIGIPLCVKWKMKGMTAALLCLLFLSGISFQNLELDDRYWHVGLSLTMAFSFIVLTLSLEEAQGLINKLQLESQSRLDNFVLLDEKWKGAEQEWVSEKEKSRTEVMSLTQDFAKTQEDKQTFYKLAQLAKDELIQVREQHDQLLQDLLYKKQQIAQLHERLEETEMTIQEFVNSDAEKRIEALTDNLTHLDREKEHLKAKLALSQTEGFAWQQEKVRLCQDLQASHERERLCLIDQQRSQQDKVEQQSALQAFQGKYSLLEQEKNTILQAQTGLQQQIEQLRYVETQHRQTVQQAQRKIQELEVKLGEEEQQKESLQQLKKGIEEQFIQKETSFKHSQEQYQAHLQQLQNQLKVEKEKSEKQLIQAQQQVVEQSQQEKKALVQEFHVVQERYQQAQETLLQLRQDLEAKNKALNETQQTVAQLSHELREQQTCVQNNTQHIQDLNQLKAQLEQDLKESKESKEQGRLTKHQSESQHASEVKLPYAPGNTRRIEAMYLQLKEQFQEKCQVLDTTRRELFHTNEQLLKWQKEQEEEQIFDQSINEKSLQRHVLQLGKQHEQMQQRYQQEVEELTQLIGHLLAQLPANKKA